MVHNANDCVPRALSVPIACKCVIANLLLTIGKGTAQAIWSIGWKEADKAVRRPSSIWRPPIVIQWTGNAFAHRDCMAKDAKKVGYFIQCD